MAASEGRPSRRRTRRCTTKSRGTYREPDSESDFEVEIPNTQSRPNRSSRRIQTYRESSTTHSSSSTDHGSDSESAFESQEVGYRINTSQKAHSSVRRSQQARPKNTKQRATSASVRLNLLKRRKLGHPRRSDIGTSKEIARADSPLPVNLDPPPWQTLEYQILLKIMQYAAYPLYSSPFRSSPSIEWLTGVSLLCKSFYDAATSALLYNPPLLPTFRARGLVARLSQDQEKLTTNYRIKVRSLDMEVNHLFVRKSGVNLRDLIRYTPLLSHLRIFHFQDEMIGKTTWASPRIAHYKWSYSNLFEWLDEANIFLKSFEWNGRFQDTISAMGPAHQKLCLRNLEEISLVNLNFTEKEEADRLRARDDMITALSFLPNLHSIGFRTSTVLDLSSMTQLPVGLRSLKIVNCLSLTSEGVESYLVRGGNSIHILHLEGNQVMDLAFIPRLSELCPVLERLYIDLSYEDCSSYGDRDPLYDELLPKGSPTWPSSLISIMVGPLRLLDVHDAEDFYKSLINAAESLPYLRMLSLKTILNVANWRDRASMRRKWRPLFEKVFSADKTYSPSVMKPESEVNKLSRKSARIQEMEEMSISEDVADDIELPTGISTIPRQNRCEIVEFELSDQRPAQEQWREADFLDTEPSDDDDEWNE